MINIAEILTTVSKSHPTAQIINTPTCGEAVRWSDSEFDHTIFSDLDGFRYQITNLGSFDNPELKTVCALEYEHDITTIKRLVRALTPINFPGRFFYC